MRKYDLISALSEETAREVARNDRSWKKYLNTASGLYKYPFKDQLLIYAQRPDATACASIEIWNEKMHCWVNKGAKGIALIDEEGSPYTGLRYVFDISDVHKARRIGRFPQLWEMKEEHQEAVLDRLEQIYGDTDKEAGFVDRIREIASMIAEDCYKELASDMEYLKEGSFLEELDELNTGVRIRETLADSIAYTVLKRCGMDEKELSEEIEFPYIHEFNTVETLSHIGNSVSDLSKPVLMEIGKAIGAYDRENARNQEPKNLGEKGLANTSDKRYNALKRESERQDGQSITQTGKAGERENNDESDIRKERGLLNLKIVYIYIQPTDTLLADTPQKPNHTEKEFLHMKSIFEQLGGTYHEENGYLIPDLRLPAEKEQPISTWGQRHLHYLKQYRKVTYTNLLICGKLNIYLADIDKQAQERFERLIEDMKRAQGITERLKEENALEWTGRLGNIRACAREIVNEEIIYA
ncbi:hypothetical protein IMSAGC013_01523 [Lachnospiraceae bacterium]|nr:hypothetical protein IMSAGC013_01523 [Lachnospiraceae bacterium]